MKKWTMLCTALVWLSVGTEVLAAEIVKKGCFGSITRKKSAGTLVAVKTFDCELQQVRLGIPRLMGGNRIADKLSHPGCVNIYSITEAGAQSEIQMELLYGKTREEIQCEGFVPEARLRNIAEQLLEVVAYLQAQQILHGDLKPANLQFRNMENTKLVLVDWDFARYFTTKPHSLSGTMLYLAPEVSRPASSTHHLHDPDVVRKAESFSAGMILHELVTGSFPEEVQGLLTETAILAHRRNIYSTYPPKLRHIDGMALPASLVELLQKLLASKAENRWTAQEALDQSAWLKEE